VLVVFGTDGQDDSALSQEAGSLLYRYKSLGKSVSLAKHQSAHAVVTDNAAPDGVVEIEHKTFPRCSIHSAYQSHDVVRIKRTQGWAEWQLCSMPLPSVAPPFMAHRCRKPRYIDEQPTTLVENTEHVLVKSLYATTLRTSQARVEAAE